MPNGDGLERQTVERKAREKAAALLAAVPRSKVVSIDTGMPLLKDEPPLAGYLRILAKETHLTVVSYWPQDDHRALYRMPSSIVRQTIPQALGYLCYIYHCDWTQDGTAVRFRAKP